MSPPEKTHRASALSREAWTRRLQVAWARRAKTRGNRSLLWRLCVPAVFLLAGALFITSANSSGGADLRAGRYSDLSSLVRQEQANAEELVAESADLQAEIDALTKRIGDADVEEVQERRDALLGPAGLEPVKGPGLTVELDDASDELVAATDLDERGELIVHQQDIQAVVNAMWAGGAEAMTLMGQRIISTTGIKCIGNTVRLHGVPYAPPYVITAVGDPDAMLTSITNDPYIKIYRQYVEQKGLGWEVEPHTSVELPAFEVVPDLSFARAAATESSPAEDDDI